MTRQHLSQHRFLDCSFEFSLYFHLVLGESRLEIDDGTSTSPYYNLLPSISHDQFIVSSFVDINGRDFWITGVLVLVWIFCLESFLNAMVFETMLDCI